jgi:aminoglycoside N3'-acetyltransferase
LNTLESLKNDFKSLGISESDTVFIRGDLGKVGRIEGKKRELFLQSLQEVIGKNGTIVSLGFTKAFPFYRVDKSFVFDSESLPITGALGKLFLNYPDCKRSSHPTNSFFAIGRNAKYIVDGHNEKSLSYSPIEKIIKLKAKMIVFGTILSSPGFTTVHYAQEVLGLTQKSLFKGLYKVYYMKNGKKKLFVRKDAGGCSKGFSKFYQHYIHHGIVKLGCIGESTAMLVPADMAYKIEYELLTKDPSYLFCDDISCLSCRATWSYDLKYTPYFIISKIFKRLF